MKMQMKPPFRVQTKTPAVGRLRLLFTTLGVLTAMVNALLFSSAALSAPVAAQPEPGPGTGEMLVYPDAGKEPLSLPLKHTRVSTSISGIVSTVQVTQEFGNPYTKPIEAVYVFPLPQTAAVYAMKMVIGERVIEGEIKLREEARELYERAKQAGQTASLLDQERPNIFTQSVANILPGDDIRVEISYFQDLAYEDGRYEYVFPMVVGPRYISGQASGRSGTGWSPDTDRIPDASRISPPLLPPGTRSGHDIEIRIDLDAGMPLRDLETPSHQIRVENKGASHAVVTLSDKDRIPNKDFILRWKVDQKGPIPGWLAHKDDTEGYFLLLLQPEVRLPRSATAPREYVFVIDSSGSMNGFPLEQCKRIVRRCLRDLKADDRFQVILFAGTAQTLAPSALEASEENIRRALAVIDSASGSGGTEFLPALEKALDAPKDPERSRIVLFLSDGYIGYEKEVLKYMHEHREEANLFPLGVGSSVNRFLIDAMARIGQGEPFYLTPNEDPDPVVNRFFSYVSRPSLTHIEVRFEGVEISDLEPARLPDLFSGRPLSLVGKYSRGGRGRAVISGWLAGKKWEQTLKVELPEGQTGNPGLGCLWARRGIECLSDQQAIGLIPEEQARKEITELALQYSLMSAYTSFVAIDSLVRNPGGESETVAVPVPLPDQVSPLAAPGHAYVTGAQKAVSGGDRFMAQSRELCEERPASLMAPASPVARSENKIDTERQGFANVSEAAADKGSISKTSAVDSIGAGAGAKISDLRVHGALDESMVELVILKALEEWAKSDCLQSFQGTLTLSLELSARGKVLHARLIENSDEAQKVSECLLRLARRLSFPETPAKSFVEVELTFGGA